MFLRLATVQAVLIVFQILMYFGCEYFQHNFHNVKRKIDDSIPFLPFTALPYSFWFPLIVIFPITLYYLDQKYYGIYMLTMALEVLLSVICYLIYPTTFERPTPPDTFWGNIMKVIYKGSYRGVNCAPSLHCSSCFLIIFVSTACSTMPLQVRIIYIAVAAMIVIATMTTKQHTVIDVVSAVALFAVCYFIGLPFFETVTNWLIAVIAG